MAMASLQGSPCTSSSLAQPCRISSAFQCHASPHAPPARSTSMASPIRACDCAAMRRRVAVVSASLSSISGVALQMCCCRCLPAAHQQDMGSIKHYVHPGFAPSTGHMRSMPPGIVLQVRPCGLVFAHQQDVGSNRQSHERDWQHLERCLKAPAASKTTTKEQDTGRTYRVAYQGHAGAYSHAVIDEVYGYSAEAIPCGEFAAAFSAVESCVADLALIPIQNSLDGSIHRNYDLLLRNHLHIVAEFPWKVRHCLLARPDTHPTQLRRVIGHPQALSHCHQTLASLGFSRQSLYAIEDTTLAVQDISDTTAIVASSKAAHAFGLRIVSDSIQDDEHNVTRFLQLAREPITPPSQDLSSKTTVAFMLENGPSDLCKAMSFFALRGIKVTNLESRPAHLHQGHAEYISKGALAAGQFRYVFVVDIDASSARMEAQTAMKQLQRISSYFRVLGSYPVL